MNRHERRAQGKSAAGKIDDRVASGYLHYQRGELQSAEMVFRTVLRQDPSNCEALRLLGEVLIDQKRYDESIALLLRLAETQPKHFLTHYTLANAYRLSGKLDDAIATYQIALDLNPRFAGAYQGLGAALQKAERETEAVYFYKQAVLLQPAWASAWRDLGVALGILGNLAAAEDALKRAVALQPALGDAHRHLAGMRTNDENLADVLVLKSLIGDPLTPLPDRVDALFALGKTEDRIGHFEEAFKYFQSANLLLRAAQVKAGLHFDRERLAHDVDGLIAAFTAERFAAMAKWGHPSAAPVFIVGMPRSGSTLFEQVAAAHSKVFGAGEQDTIGRVAAAIGRQPDTWNAKQIHTCAETYLASVYEKAGNADRIVDKMPDNIFKLGLIAAMFPSARIVFCLRDERDIALSCYFQHFAQPLGYDTDLGDCIFRIREIDRLTAHWRENLPLRTMTLSYETFLSEPETEARRLVDFMDLEWEPACRSFQSQQRIVRTASWAQVRQPLYHTSVGRWRHYKAQLESAIWRRDLQLPSQVPTD